jgi:hypothetical protein
MTPPTGRSVKLLMAFASTVISGFSLNQSQSKVTLQLAVYCQSVRLGVKPLETHDQTIFFN